MRSLVFLISVLISTNKISAADLRIFSIADADCASTPDGANITNCGTGISAIDGCTINKTVVAGEFQEGRSGFVLTVNKAATSYTGLNFSLHGFKADYFQTRDFRLIESVRFWLNNQTAVSFRLKVEWKDFRNSGEHALVHYLTIPKSIGWRQYTVNLASMTKVGNLDTKQMRSFHLVIEPGEPVSGRVFLDEVALRETGAVAESSTATMQVLDDILLRRCIIGLYGSRDRQSFFIPRGSDYPNVLAINSTGGLCALLPVAVARGVLSQDECDAYVLTVCASLARMTWRYVPPRYLLPGSLAPNFKREESPVDAAILAAGLLKYRSFTNTPAVRSAVDSQLARFDIGGFYQTGAGFRGALIIGPDTFTNTQYQDYSAEVHLMALMAHLIGPHRVPITSSWNSGTRRLARSYKGATFVVSSNTQFRSPFMQWLLPVLVDVSSRGVDNFPVTSLRVNPYYSALGYQRYANSVLSGSNRGPIDAGIDIVAKYKSFSIWYGPSDLTHPWSCGFSGLVDDLDAIAVKRRTISFGHHSLFGFSECAQGGVPVGRADFWNVCLYALAVSSQGVGGNRVLADDSTVKSAMNEVFPSTGVSVRSLFLSPQDSVDDLFDSVWQQAVVIAEEQMERVTPRYNDIQ